MPLQPSEMSFALSMDSGKLEWGSHSLDTVFAQRSNLANPAFLRWASSCTRACFAGQGLSSQPLVTRTVRPPHPVLPPCLLAQHDP